MIVGLLAMAALVVRWKTAAVAEPGGRARGPASTQARRCSRSSASTGLFALTSNLNIGHRHLLPIYPALCILAGGAAFWIQPLFERTRMRSSQTGRERAQERPRRQSQGRRSGWLTDARCGDDGAAGVARGRVGDHQAELPGVLQPTGGRTLAGLQAPGRQLAGLGTGPAGAQAVARWARVSQRAGGSNVYLSYFGTARPEYYGIQATLLAGFIDRRPPQPPVPLGGGVYCISATVLDVIGRMFYKPEYESNYQAALKNMTVFARASENEQAMSALMQQTGEHYWRQLFVQFDQLRTGRLVAFLRREPDAMVGYSILIYRLTDADVAQALNGRPPHSKIERQSGILDGRMAKAKKHGRRPASAVQTHVERAPATAACRRLLGACRRIVRRVRLPERARQRLRPRRHPHHSRQPAHPLAREHSGLFASSYWGLSGAQALYRPLVLATYAVNYAMHGLSTYGYTPSTSPCTRPCRFCSSRSCAALAGRCWPRA